jgi:arginyl-tRNA synthetase
MNLFAVFEAHIRNAVAELGALFATPPDLTRVVAEPPREASHGDIATNAALVLAKQAGLKPRELAERLAQKLQALPDVASVEVAGPGFINLGVAPAFWPRVLAAILSSGEAFGRTNLGKGETVNVEFVSANPTGPMHVGHCRGAVVGDALARLLEGAGYAVTREYYINDAGAQVDILARSAYLRYREALGETIAIPEGLYPGDYLKPVGETLALQHGEGLVGLPEDQWLPIVREVAMGAMMDLIRADLRLLSVRHDVFFSERSLQTPVDLVAKTIAELRARGDIYEGRLPPPKGQRDEDWEDREQTLFRSTAHGDDADRPLMKADGSYTYFASDIAYHKSKFDRGFATMIDIWGADHGGYIKRMQAAVRAVTGDRGALDVKLCQLVRLLRGGEPVKMSKRSGDFVTLREVVEEVGPDPVRFIMLMRKNDAPLDFDLAKVIEQSKDNPVFYVQYAHARCRSTFRQAREILPDIDSPSFFVQASLERLNHVGEVAILKNLAQYPRLLEQAAVAHEPHRIAFYLYDLASEFHAHWNRGKDMPHLRFIRDEDGSLTRARLALVRGVEVVLASGLKLLGVRAPNEMR